MVRFPRRIPLLLLAGLLLIPLSAGARKARKKKLSLAQLAALEWKLEENGKVLREDLDTQARLRAVEVLAAIDDARVIRPLARTLMEDPRAEVRRAAAVALGKHKTPEAKGLLLLASRTDPDEGVRAAARKALARFPRRLALARLPLRPRPYAPKRKPGKKALRKLFTSPSGDARLYAVRALAKRKLKGRVRLLTDALTMDPSARVRAEAARVLVRIQGKTAIPLLVGAAQDKDPSVRFAAAELLSGFEDVRALTVIQQMAERDPDPAVREEAKDLLEPATAVGRKLLEQRIGKLRSPNPAERIRALEALSRFSHWRAMVPMSCALLGDESKLVRATAAKILTNMHDVSVLTALRVAAVIEPDPGQLRTIRTLLKGLRRKVDLLKKDLKSPDVARRLRAARALGQAAYPQAFGALVAALKDKDPRVRLRVVKGLRNYEGEKAAQALRRASADPDRRVRAVVDRYFRERERLMRLRRLYKDPNRLVVKANASDPEERIDAAIALGIAGAERATPTLAELLRNDPDERVRLAAAWALVLMANDASEAALRRAAAKDRSEKVRLAARKYLVIGKVSADDLIEQLRSGDAGVRRDAAEALSLRASGPAQQHLTRAALCDPDPNVRAAALRGLARIGNRFARTVLRVASRRDASKRVRGVAAMMYILAGGK